MRLQATTIGGAVAIALPLALPWTFARAAAPAGSSVSASPAAPSATGPGAAAPSSSIATPASIAAGSGAGCGAWDATYTLSGTLRIAGTPMGAGDGVHAVGPGTMVLRFDDEDGQKPGHVELRSFEILQHFSLQPKSFIMSADIVTHAMARAGAGADGVVAAGTLAGDALRWDTAMRGYHTDGTLSCDGSLCGNFGAPPAGKSPLHSAPRAVQLQPFRFKGSGLTVQMPQALVSQDTSPPQKGYLALSGKAKSWVCVRARRVDAVR
jgi:hypothetical protein